MIVGILCLAIALGALGGVATIVLRGRDDALQILDTRLAAYRGPSASLSVAPPRRPIALPERVTRLLIRAQIEPTPQLVGALSLGFMLLFALALGLSGPGVALIVCGAFATALFFYVRMRARKRTEALVDALPLYLDGVRQLMTIGNSLPQALTRALTSAAEPVQSLLGPAARRIELGAPIGESLQQIADRLSVPEVSMLSAAVRTNLRFGGSMATILSNLGHILRERVRIKRELGSATAEAKVSAQMLTLFPILLVVFLLTTNAAYRHFFFVDPRGHRLAAFAGGLQLVGMMVMARLKRIAF